MSRLLFLCFLHLLLAFGASGQRLAIKGTVTCSDSGKEEDELPLSQILLTPLNEPGTHTISSNTIGYYQLNLKRDLENYMGIPINIRVKGRGNFQELHTTSVHYKENLTRLNSFYFFDYNILLKQNCSNIKLSGDDILIEVDALQKQAEELAKKDRKKLKGIGSGGALISALFLSILGGGSQKPPLEYDSMVSEFKSVLFKNADYFQFGNSEKYYQNKYSFNLGRSTGTYSHNGDAPLQSSTNMLGSQGIVLGLYGNLNNYFLSSAYFSKNEYAFGGGVLYHNLANVRLNYQVAGKSAEGNSRLSATEKLFFASFAHELNSKIDLGSTLKVRNQIVGSIPEEEVTNNYYLNGGIIYSESELLFSGVQQDTKFDFDVSINYKFSDQLRWSNSIKNLLNTEMIVSTWGSVNLFTMGPSRSFLTGVNYFRKRFEIGATLWLDQAGAEATLGAKYNWHPKFTSQVGVSTLNNTISLGGTLFRFIGLSYLHSSDNKSFQLSLSFTQLIKSQRKVE